MLGGIARLGAGVGLGAGLGCGPVLGGLAVAVWAGVLGRVSVCGNSAMNTATGRYSLCVSCHGKATATQHS